MESNNKHQDKSGGMSPKVYRNMLSLIAFGILFYMALLNFEYLLKMLGTLAHIISPILIGLGIAFVLNIPMSVIERRLLKFMDKVKTKKGKDIHKLKRGVAVVLTFLFLLGLIAGLITFVIPQLTASVNTLIDKFPGYVTTFNATFDKILSFLNIPEYIWVDIVNQWDAFMKQFGEMLLGYVPKILDATVSVTIGVFNGVMGLIISVYLLIGKEKLLKLKDKLILAYLPEKQGNFINSVGITANKAFHGFIAGQITEAFILGTLCTIGLAILQVPYALLIGVLIGVTGVIPVFGAFLGAVPSGFILLVVNPISCFVFVVFIIVLQQIESNIIYPRVVGNSIGLSGLWVIIGMLIGGSLFGFLGIILGIPAFAVLYSVFREITNQRIEKKKLVA
ncbi:MAG: AI-2E family transporter [Eubacteriaceae bacterium]